MRELLRTLYEVSGSYSKRITKMLIFDVIKEISYSLGTVLILASSLCISIFKMNRQAFKRGWNDSAKTLVAAAPALFFAVPMVQVFINSQSADMNATGALPAMSMVLA